MMRVIIVLALLAIVGALALAGRAMLRRDDEGLPDAHGLKRDQRMARALAWRVGLSISLFLFVLLAYSLGWIQPHGVAVGV